MDSSMKTTQYGLQETEIIAYFKYHGLKSVKCSVLCEALGIQLADMIKLLSTLQFLKYVTVEHDSTKKMIDWMIHPTEACDKENIENYASKS